MEYLEVDNFGCFGLGYYEMGSRDVKWKEVVVGNYDWCFLCILILLWKKNWVMVFYFGKDDEILLFVVFVMGF